MVNTTDANRLGRGLTAPITHIDENAYVSEIEKEDTKRQYSPPDIYLERLNFMETRLQRLESAIEQTLELAIRTQQSAELVTTSVIHKTFDLITKQLANSLIAMQQSAEDTLEDFKIEVVDHVKVKPTEETLIVTRTPEGELQYAKMSEPDVQLMGEVDKLDKYFNARPELFNNDKVIFNAYIRKAQQ